MSIRVFRLLFALALVFAEGLFAQSTSTSDYSFPLVGVASSETLGINLINLASSSGSSCTGSVTFINAANNATIGTAATYNLASNAATSITLPFSSTGFTGIRGLVRAVIAMTVKTTPGVPCSLAYSLNTYDSGTGVTHVFLSGSGGPSAIAIPIFGR